jgi:NAD(P)H-dependent FMN reductase
VQPGSNTGKALRLALDEFAKYPDVEVAPIYLDKLDLPLPGLAARDPAAVERFQRTVKEATGVLLASPEYHGGVSSPMKLAIDNLGYPSTLSGKPVALLGVAAGAIGAIKSLEQLRGICSHVGGMVLPLAVSVARVHQVFDEQGNCRDAGTEKFIRSAATGLLDYIRGAICPRIDLEGIVRRSQPSDLGQLPLTSRCTHASFAKAREEFDQAWNNPKHTRIELEAVDVNDMLERSYAASAPLRMTKPMLWDAETRKFWDPTTYIPHAVRENRSWGRKALEDGGECFLRANRQRAWKAADVSGQVLEEIYLDPRSHSTFGLGRAKFLGEDGAPLEAGSHQPLFHVEHAVGGTHSRPLNLWRIVHLTTEQDDALRKRQLEAGSGWVGQFAATYIEKNLGIKMTRRQVPEVVRPEWLSAPTTHKPTSTARP